MKEGRRETAESCGCNRRPGEGYERADRKVEVGDLELKGRERLISDEGRRGTGEMREGRSRPRRIAPTQRTDSIEISRAKSGGSAHPQNPDGEHESLAGWMENKTITPTCCQRSEKIEDQHYGRIKL